MGRNQWDQLYGDFDCEANAVAYWMDVKGISSQAFVGYNWDFYFDGEEVLLRGCIRVPQLIEFLRLTYGLTVTEISFDQIPEGELVIIPANAYWLPYSPDHYMTQRLVHYYVAEKWKNGKFQVWDSIFNNMGGLVEEAVLHKAFQDVDRTALFLETDTVRTPLSLPQPFLIGGDYTSSYGYAKELFLQEVYPLLERTGDLMKDLDFKRYFGNIQSILLARELYFQRIRPGKGTAVVNGWRNAIKHYMRLAYFRQKGWDSFKAAVVQAIQEEAGYLSSWTEKIKDMGEMV